MARLQAHLPRQGPGRADRRRVDEIRLGRQQQGGEGRGAPGQIGVDDHAFDLAEVPVTGALPTPAGAHLAADSRIPRHKGYADAIAFPVRGAQESIVGRGMEIAAVDGGLGEHVHLAADRPARAEGGLALSEVALVVADEAAADALDRGEVDIGDGAPELQAQAIEAMVEGDGDAVGLDVAAARGAARCVACEARVLVELVRDERLDVGAFGQVEPGARLQGVGAVVLRWRARDRRRRGRWRETPPHAPASRTPPARSSAPRRRHRRAARGS